MIPRRDGTAHGLGRVLLGVGVLLRVVTWTLLNPENRDFHLGVLLRIIDTGQLPLSNETDQSYHPPFYYVLAAPILYVTSRPRAVALLSLIFSIATLCVLYQLVVRTTLLGRMRERLALFALVAVHPQLITYGLYISNDTLTILLGTLVMWQFWRWLETPSDARLRWLALCCALGLLTKATFLAIVPVVAVYVLAVAKRIDRSTMWRRVGEFLAIAIVVGCYKYVENYWHFGTPFVSNLDAGYSWIADQTRGRTMPWAYVGFDPLRLLRHPLGNERRPYLEMLYETFWYEYLPMSNLATARRWPYYFTGSAVLVAALVPTLVMVVGAIKAFTSMWAPLTASRPPSRLDRINIVRYLSISVGVAVLALLVVEEMRTHVWSVMHGRLLLPAMLGALLALRVGWTSLRRIAPRIVDRVLLTTIILMAILMLVQHGTDLALVAAQRFSR